MKKSLYLFIAIFLTCLSSLALCVNAEEKSATFTTDVPAKHNINLTLKGQGPILINDSPYNNGALILVDDHSNAIIKLPPDSNLRINKITINGEDVTDKIVNNTFEIKDITYDIDLYVEVVEAEKTPTPAEDTHKGISKIFSTGDTTNLIPYIVILSVSAVVIVAVIFIIKKKKQTY